MKLFFNQTLMRAGLIPPPAPYGLHLDRRADGQLVPRIALRDCLGFGESDCAPPQQAKSDQTQESAASVVMSLYSAIIGDF